MSRKDLQDHAEELLDAIVSDMQSSQSSLQQTGKSKGRDMGGAQAWFADAMAARRIAQAERTTLEDNDAS